MNIGEILVTAISGSITIVGTQKLTELFDQLHKNDTDAHKTVVLALYPILKGQLEPLTDKSKTKIDDAITDAFVNAVEATAEKFGIELPAV